ncbi:VWFA and cache domain-containing protein 1 [Asbolus verrucosus]|uniref:VWFA and cache domain-containing protein 1 n=1 Tax=Asbolus verrucosus TaxID=1661398 RepID=A0A482W4M5_ASBVE|nr:VWFA and cache domain-containing protein 1 [Asbolus verrucosus]
MRSISKELSEDLAVIKTEELEIDYVKKLYASFKYTSTVIDANKTKGIKQQYFISSSDVESYPYSPFTDCNEVDHMLMWNSFMSRNNYSPRNIVLLLDHGGSLSKHHFYIVKSIAKQVVASLNEKDNIALLAISNDWSSPQLTEECLMPNQVPSIVNDVPKFTSANPTRKKILYKFIDGMYKGNGATNHSLGLQKALKVIEQNQIQNETVMILYVSRGLLSSLTEAKTVLETILQASENVTSPFIINTCTAIDGKSSMMKVFSNSRPTIYETQFMEDIAFQNYNKYNISVTKNVQNGTMVAVNSSKTIGFALSLFYNIYNLNSSYNIEKRISLPMWDHQSDDLTLTFSIGCLVDNQFGLLGIDVYFASWAEDLIYFSNIQKDYYAFLMDLEGRVIMHPKFASLTTVKQQLQYVDISNFENAPFSHDVKSRLLSERKGTHIATQFGFPTKWTWRRVGDWYVVCVVTRESLPSTRPYQINWPFNASETYSIKLVYQHLENSENSKLCRHLNQVATLDAGSLYLSSSCFQSPSSLQEMKNQESLQNYMAYLQDNTQLLRNPGLKEEIKDEVAALAHILSFLRTQHLSSYKSKYIVRRYVTSYSGVLQMFPGSILDQGLDPTKRPWFLQAVEHKFKLIMVPPYLDEGGAGYIVTIAYATSNVVVAIDTTYGYIFRMLLKRMPFCLSTNITCFLMDDRGYLIYHPNLIDPNGHGPVEKQHIVHKESLVANDILSHKLFIKKVLCNSYGGGTVQRYYKLNTSYNDVLVNSVQGEQCVSYHIVAIRDTNIFIGMVNATCNVVVTFCPCSIVDRLCLNCNRMEQKECECPCECPMEQNKCTDFNSIDNPLCTWFPEHVSLKAHFHEDATNEMKSCFPATCSAEKTHFRCLGVTGCEWCKYDVDGSLLENPFCASMATCFNGIVGSVTPYRNSPNEMEIPEESFNVPISVITLFIFGVFLLLCMFYIYHRSTTPQTAERLYLSSTQDNHLRMSDLNLSDNFHTVGNHRDKLLQDDKPDPLSPYCVSSNYKRTTIAADSDHGYSTMTQHDESEHMSLAPVELDSLEDDLGSDSVSVHTSVSSRPHGNESTQFTCIPRNKCIVVPVTVHRNMETT